jgi:TonB family protein
MPTLPKALVSRSRFTVLALLLGMTYQVSAQTAATAPAPAASSPAAVAAQQGLSESVLRQAQGPYRMILNQPVTVARPKAAPGAARAAEPVAVPTAAAAPPSAEGRKAALAVANAPADTPTATPVVARSVAAPAAAAAAPLPAPISAPVAPPEPATALSPIAPAAIAPSPVTAAAPVTSAPPPKPMAAAVAAVERPLIAVRQEEPLLSGPLARERPTGVVQVGFNVNADGSTGDVSVVSSTNRKLNSAVLNAVTKWVYQPLEAVRRVEVAIEFKND